MIQESIPVDPITTLVYEDAEKESSESLALSIFEKTKGGDVATMKLKKINGTLYEIDISPSRMIFDRLKRKGKV